MTQNQGQSLQGLLNLPFTFNDFSIYYLVHIVPFFNYIWSAEVALNLSCTARNILGTYWKKLLKILVLGTINFIILIQERCYHYHNTNNKTVSKNRNSFITLEL